MRRALIVIAIAGSAVLLGGLVLKLWSARFAMASYETVARQRDRSAREAGAVMKVAVVWPQGADADSDSLWNGASLAAYEINRCGLGGRLDPTDIQKCVVEGRRRPAGEGGSGATVELARYCPPSAEEIPLARELAQDPGLVAVVGHSSSELSKFASVSYNYTQLLYMTVDATEPSITNHGFSYVFRNAPTDLDFARVLSRIKHSDTDRVGAFYALAPHSMASATTVTTSFARSEPQVLRAFFKAYDPGLCVAGVSVGGDDCRAECLRCATGSDTLKGFLYHVYTWGRRGQPTCEEKEKALQDTVNNVGSEIKVSTHAQPDLLLVSDDRAANAGRVISELRAQKFSQPIIGGLGLDSTNLFGPDAAYTLHDDDWFHPVASGLTLPYQKQPEDARGDYVRTRAAEVAPTLALPGAAGVEFPDEMVGLIRTEVDNYLAGAEGGAAGAFGANNFQILDSVAAHADDIRAPFAEKHLPPAMGFYLALIDPRLEPCRAAPAPPGGLDTLKAAVSGGAPPASCGDAARAVADALAARRSYFGTDVEGGLFTILSDHYQTVPASPLPPVENRQEREKNFWARLLASGVGTEGGGAPAVFTARLVAAAIIAQNPDDFGLDANPLYFEQVSPNTVFVATVFSPDLDLPGVRDFVAKFNKFHEPKGGAARPDTLAAQGYEAVSLLGQAGQSSQNFSPTNMAQSLRAGVFRGLTGDLTFAPNGDAVGKQIVVKAFRK